MYLKKMKRIKVLFCLLFICVSCCCLSVQVFARAGGDGTSGGGSGSGSFIVFQYRTRKARNTSIHLMEKYQESGVNWDYKEVQAHVEKGYFIIQEAWRRYDTSYADGYLSQELSQK